MITRLLMTLALSVSTQVATADEGGTDGTVVDENEGLDLFELFDADADEGSDESDESDETTPLEERSSCSRYNQYGNNAYYYCTQDWQCRWNGRYCVDAQPATRCEYIRDYYQCRRAGCYWDNYYGCRSGGGGYRVWECEARDTGWEEHWSGHVGRGYSQYEARRAALRACQRPYGPHGQCYVSECRRVN